MSAVDVNRRKETEDEKTAREYRESQAKQGAPFGDSGIKSEFAAIKERLASVLPKRPSEEERKAAREKRIEKLKEKKEEIELNTAIEKSRYQREQYQQKIAKQRSSSINIGFGGGTLDPLEWYGLTGQNKSAAGMAFDVDAYNSIFNNYGSVGADKRPKRPWNGNIMDMPAPSGGLAAPDLKKVRAFYGF